MAQNVPLAAWAQKSAQQRGAVEWTQQCNNNHKHMAEVEKFCKKEYSKFLLNIVQV